MDISPRRCTLRLQPVIQRRRSVCFPLFSPRHRFLSRLRPNRSFLHIASLFGIFSKFLCVFLPDSDNNESVPDPHNKENSSFSSWRGGGGCWESRRCRVESEMGTLWRSNVLPHFNQAKSRRRRRREVLEIQNSLTVSPNLD